MKGFSIITQSISQQLSINFHSRRARDFRASPMQKPTLGTLVLHLQDVEPRSELVKDFKDLNILVSLIYFYLIVEIPPPDSYKIKTCFDGHSPTIKGNTLTTSFKQQSSRNAYEKIYVPGYTMRSPVIEKQYPGPAQYNVDLNSLGLTGLQFTLK